MRRTPNQNQGSSSRQSYKTNGRLLEEIMLTALEKDKKLVVLASSLSTHSLPAPGNVTQRLAQVLATRFPERFYGLGELMDELTVKVTELAAQGLQPLVLLNSADLAISYARLTAICAQGLRVIFLLAGGPASGQTWRPSGVNDLAILRTLSPLYIGIPSDARELLQQINEAGTIQDRPVVLYYHSSIRSRADETLHLLRRSPGVGRSIMVREGKELAILAIGPATGIAVALAQRLDSAGHNAAVVDTRWARPLDDALLTAVAHHFPRLVTIEEGTLEGSFGTAVLEMLERKGIYETHLMRLSTGTRPALVKLAGSVTAFLETLQRDEGLGPHTRPAARQPQPGSI
ncbi:MAG TPA: transketolase C-terminal domain-containing protein [Chloroflexia bacterium]|nr:transketolase C-terminal domain-containing protein [Chloroflexia bacterium]